MNFSRDTNTTQPSDLRTQSWVSKAYDAAVQGQGDDPDHAANGEHPDIVINTDDNSEKVKVRIIFFLGDHLFADIKPDNHDTMLIHTSVPWWKQLAVSDCFLGHASAKEKTPDRNTMFQGRNALCGRI